MIFDSVFYIPKLKTNILSLEKLDSQGCDIHLWDGFLTLHDDQGRLLTKTPKTRRNMHLLKLNIVEHCILVERMMKRQAYDIEGYVIKVLVLSMTW